MYIMSISYLNQMYNTGFIIIADQKKKEIDIK